jgi:eukaryotic-like serine/threonine-protein kinase
VPLPRPHLLRTTVVQAFARTIVDDAQHTLPSNHGAPAIPGDLSDELPPSSSAPSTAGLPKVGDVVGSHYRLVRMLGEGMFGKVYVAQRIDVPEHQVALKLLPRALYQGRNVERELVMLATVGHPHVVQLKDHGTTPEYVWLTMPVYEGETLAERLARGPLTLRRAHDIFLPMARGLEALHAAGLRHQDVKPENIFLAVFGGHVHPVLLDLGVAAERDAEFVAGTALYGAPEQVTVLAGFVTLTPLSEKMDTYGLAATLLYALVGPAHFPGEHAQNRRELCAAQKLRTEEPLGPGALPELTGAAREKVSAAFRRWLAEDPNERPSMKALAEQLDVLLEQEREEDRLEERRRARQRSTVLAQRIGIAAMLLLGAAGGAVVWSKRETLRVASELAAARRKGKESFDKLDTCSASYQMARAQADACVARGARDRAEYERSLEGLTQSGTATDAERAREVQRVNGRVKSCEEGADKARRSYEEELAQREGAAARLKAQLSEERDRAQVEVAAERSEAFAMQAERDVCRAERTACEEERTACRAEKARSSPVVPARLPGLASAAPIAPPPGAGTSAEPPVPQEPKAPAPLTPPSTQPAQAPPPEPKPPPAPPLDPKGP